LNFIAQHQAQSQFQCFQPPQAGEFTLP
jgi:hypothetical protein